MNEVTATPPEGKPPEQPSSAQIRNHRIKLSAVSSVVSKIAGISIPLIILPLASRNLGADYDGIMAIASLAGIISIVSLGQGAAACYRVAKYATEPNEQAEQSIFISSLVSGLVSACIIALIILGITPFVPIQNLFGPQLTNQEPLLRIGILYLGIQIIVNALNGGAVNMFTGYMETHQIRLQMAISYILTSIITPFIIIYTKSAPLTMITMMGLPTILQLGLLVKLLYKDKPHLRNSLKQFNLKLSADIFIDNVKQSISDAGEILSRQVPILSAGFIGLSSTQIGKSGTFLNWQISLLSIFVMLTGAIAPSVSHAFQDKDWDWIDRAYKKVMIFLGGAGLLGILVLTFLGPMLSSALYKARYAFDGPEFFLLALTLVASALKSWQSSLAQSMGMFSQNLKSGLIQATVAIAVLIPASQLGGVYPLALCMISADFLRSIYLIWTYRKFRAEQLALIKATA